MTSLKHKTVSGIKWTMAASIAQRILSFGTTVILARVLSPADFGLFTLAFVMVDGFSIFKSLGFDSALVRRKVDDIGKACNTAFFLIPAMGLILFIILFFFAPIGAKFLNNSQVTPIIRTLAFVFVVSTLGKVPQAILYRDMQFKYGFISEISSQIIYVSIALILALSKFGVWSLVVAYVLRNIVKVGIDWYFSGWKPRFEFDSKIAWDMFHFGKFILGSSVVLFLNTNLDNLVIGKVLGVTLLGYYAISKNLANFLNDYVLSRMSSVMFPAYSKIQEDTENIKHVMFKMLKYISVVIFPFSFGLFLFAPEVLRLIFGEKWLPATDVLRVLSLAGLTTSLNTAISPIFLARGQSKIDFQVGLAQAVIFFLLIVPLSIKFKLVGVGYATLASSVISLGVGIFRIRGILNLRVIDLIKPLRSAFLCSMMILSGFVLLKVFSLTENANFEFMIFGTISALVYSGSIYCIDRNILKEIKKVFL